MTQAAPQPLKVLCVLGHFETLASNGWELPAALLAAGYDVTIREQCIGNESSPNAVTMPDIQAADIVYCYSHGLDSIKTLTNQFQHCPPLKLLVITLGVVSDIGIGGNDVFVYPQVAQVVCWQVTPPQAVPVSVPVKPLDGVIADEEWYAWGDTAGEAAIVAGHPRININCNALATDPSPIANHINVPNNKNLLAAQVRIHGELAALME